MNKFHIVIGGVILVVLSVSITLWIVNHPIRPVTETSLNMGPSEPETVLAPEDLIIKPAADAQPTAAVTDTTTSSPSEVAQPAQVLYPQWQTSPMRIVEAQPVTPAQGYTLPLWSPTGLDIAYTTSDRNGIFVTAPDAISTRTLSDDTRIGTDFSWNIDGMSLHVKQPDGQYVELMITGEKYPAVEREPKVFERDNLIWLRDENDQLLKVSGSQDRFFSPKLSPDESKVVYIGRETGIYISNADGSHTISIGKGANPSWFPDSMGIVFDVPVGDGSNVVDGDIWYASALGVDRANLTNTPGIVESHASVGPDGERIAFTSAGTIYVGRLNRNPKK